MSRPFRLGLTGSIGMGKSTTARFFAEAGVPVWDADAAVHRLYAAGGAGAAAIAALHPQAIRDGAVDRAALKDWIARDKTALPRIEAAIHPLVGADRAAFIAQAAASGAAIVVLDIPLLFETGGEAAMDGTVVVSAPAEVQRERVLARPGMTEAQLATILARQMPDAEKRARATWVIETTTLEAAARAVRQVIAEIRERMDA
jgi:dephospho-CoA kinase